MDRAVALLDVTTELPTSPSHRATRCLASAADLGVIPRSTGDRVYILGAAGMLSCFDTGTGDLIWRVDTVADYSVTVPVFGVSQSPLVEGDHLIMLLVGEPDAMVVAFDTATGAIWWQYDFPDPSGLTIGTPVQNGRYLLVTQIENGGLMLALNPDRPPATGRLCDELIVQ